MVTDEDHRKAVGRGIGESRQSIQKPWSGDGQADAWHLGHEPRCRGRIASTLLVTESVEPHPFRLRQPRQIGNRNSSDSVERVDPVEFQGIHHKVEAVSHPCHFQF